MGTYHGLALLLLKTVTLALLGCALIVALRSLDGFMLAGTICAVSGLLLLSPPRPRRVQAGVRRRGVRIRKAIVLEEMLREAATNQAILPPGHRHHPAM